MPADGVPEDIRQFLREYVNSIEQLEILLRLFEIAPHAETSAEMAKALYSSVESISSRLETFANKGLVNRHVPEPWHYSLASKESRRIGELVRLYRERRVSIINEIFSNPIASVQTFADAFIIGKKKE